MSGLGEAYVYALMCIIEGTLSAADELFQKFAVIKKSPSKFIKFINSLF